MASSKYTINGAHIECSSCLNVFEDPRILSCGHTFCLPCIIAQVAISSTKQSSVLCSMCRQLCALPDGDAGKLPKNYSLAAVTSEAKQNTSSSTLAGVVDAKFMCKTHTDQKIVVYCRDCRVLTCAICGLLTHSKHTCIEVDEADKEFKNFISVAAEQSKEKIATHCQRIFDYEDKLHQEQAQLATERRQLAHYEDVLNNDDASYIEREAVVKTLQPNPYSFRYFDQQREKEKLEKFRQQQQFMKDVHARIRQSSPNWRAIREQRQIANTLRSNQKQ